MTPNDRPNSQLAMDDFHYNGMSLFDAIDALKAYDGGAYDSGIGDESLRRAVKDYLGALSRESCRRLMARFARRYLEEESLNVGYGLDDVESFIAWLREMDLDS